MTPTLFKVAVPGMGEIRSFDAFEYEGKKWLAPHWLDNLTKGVSTPFRIIRFDNLPHHATPKAPWGEYALENPLPSALLEMKPVAGPIEGYEFRECPDIQFGLKPALN